MAGLTPYNGQLIFIDQQPQMAFGVQSCRGLLEVLPAVSEIDRTTMNSLALRPPITSLPRLAFAIIARLGAAVRAVHQKREDLAATLA